DARGLSPELDERVRIARRRDLSRANVELVAIGPVRILDEPALGGTGRARAVLVIDATVARAHEEVRLGKPAHRAAEVHAVDGEHLEVLAVDVANPAGNVGCRP